MTILKNQVDKNDKFKVNEEIKTSPIMLVDVDGKNIGSFPLSKALDVAKQLKLDLVEVSPFSKPPVCKLMNYGKFRFEQKAKQKKIKKNRPKSLKIKEIRLSPVIEAHDIDTKVKSAIKFLQAGHKVSVKLEFRRRQIVHKDLGMSIINSFIDKISNFGSLASNPKLDGKVVFCTIDPLEDIK